MKLTQEQTRQLLRIHGAYVTEACNRCTGVLGPVRWTIQGQPGLWCSKKCRDGVDHKARMCPCCGVSLNGKRKHARFCSDTCRKRLQVRNRSRKPKRAKGKKRGVRTPGPKQALVIAGAIQGKSHRQIARESGLHRETVAAILSQDEIQERVARAESTAADLLDEAMKRYSEAIYERSDKQGMAAARDVMFGMQVFKPRTDHRVTARIEAPGDAELKRRGLWGRTKEELQYWLAHGYFQEEEEKFGGKPLGRFGGQKYKLSQ